MDLGKTRLGITEFGEPGIGNMELGEMVLAF